MDDDDSSLSLNMVSSNGARTTKAKKRPRVMPKSAKMRLRRLAGTDVNKGREKDAAARHENPARPAPPMKNSPSSRATRPIPEAREQLNPQRTESKPGKAAKHSVPKAQGAVSGGTSASKGAVGKEKHRSFPDGNSRKSGKRQMHTSLFDPSTVSAASASRTLSLTDKLKHSRADADSVFSASTPHELPIDERLSKHLEGSMRMPKLTEVQQLAIPVLLKRRDLKVNSATGTGKTLAYAIPLVHDLQQLSPKIKRTDGPYAVVILPTRELVVQSREVFATLLRPYIWIVPGEVMGGEKKSSEKARLRKGVNILIATPGRLLDHIQNTDCLALNRVRWLILDEADRLLEKGFEDTLRMTIERIDRARRSHDRNPGRCTVLLSATMSEDVEALAKLSLKQPQTINVSSDNSADEPESTHPAEAATGTEPEQQFAVSTRLRQYYVTMPAKLRLTCVLAFLKWKCEPDPAGKAVVFYASRDMVRFVHLLLASLGGNIQQPSESGDDIDVEGAEEEDPLFGELPLYFLHGGMSQRGRTEVFQAFCTARRGVLFCTDVASRGLHLPRVTWIIQATAPTVVQEYVHRVGRTARLDTEGSALIMLLPSEIAYLEELKQHGISELAQVTIADILGSLVGLRPGSALVQHTKDAANALQIRCEKAVAESALLRQAASSAYRSFVRAYTTYPSHLKRVFHVKNLHYGHIAKSFALREAPTDVGTTGKPVSKAAIARVQKAEAGRKRKEDERKRRKDNAVHQNEFAGSASFSGPKTKKRRKATT